MKYRIIVINNTDFDIITEDGGVASVYYNEEALVTNYYQTRLTDIKGVNVWDELAEGKVYVKEWDEDTRPEDEVIIRDALNWLVIPSPSEWEYDNTLFSNIFDPIKRYVLYNPTDDSVICDHEYKTLLFGSYEEAQESWIGHPEEIVLFDELPLHHQQVILKEN